MAVANSSVFIALSGIGQIELLFQRFPEGILIPQAVWHEVVEAGRGQPGSAEVESASWITVCEVKGDCDPHRHRSVAAGRKQYKLSEGIC